MNINPIEDCYRQLKSQGKNILRLFSGNPIDEGIQFPGEILQKSYSEYFKTLDYHPDSKGWIGAREAIAQYYESQNALVHPENILLTSGTSESFFYLFSLLTEPGDNILTPNPAYPLFDHIAELKHIELRHYPLVEDNHWSVNIETLKQKTDSRTKAIVIISPHNPTGSVLSVEEVNAITTWANEKNIPLICDEVFSEFYFGQNNFPRVISVAQPDLCFTLNGLSKMFALPSMKLSWMAVTGQKPRVNAVVDQLEIMTDTFLSCHTAIQRALPSILNEGKNFLKEYQNEVLRRRNLAVSLLKKSSLIEYVEPQGGFYLMGHVLGAETSDEDRWVTDLMKSQNIFVHPGYFFDYEVGLHFIISFLTHPEKLEPGIQALINYIHEK